MPLPQPRKTRCWITSFVEATDHLNSPRLFRKWAAINALSATLERKVFLEVQYRRLFANLFTLLVAPPGIGKTTAIDFARRLVGSLSHLHLSPAKVTKEKFIQLMAGAMKLDQDIDSMTHSSMACMIGELATFLIPGDIDMLVLLTDLYDCPEHWEYSLLSRNPTIFENVYLTILGAITPRMISQLFGAKSIGMGFTSRCIFIHSEDRIRKAPFPKGAAPEFKMLEEDLSRVYTLRGEFLLATDAQAFVEDWQNADMPPIPNDSRFEEYLPRRFVHWMKLSMITSAGRRDSRLITLEDVEFTKNLLLEAEETMPLALEFLGQNPMMDAIKRAHRWMLVEYSTNGKQPIHEKFLRRKLLDGVSPNYLEATVQSMLTSGSVVQSSGTYPDRYFIPVVTTD